MNIRENFGFYEGQNIVLAFEKLLKKHGINVSKSSDLEDKFLSVFDVLFHFEERQRIDPDGDYRHIFRDFSALYDLALKILEVKDHKDFGQLIPHLLKLNSCAIAQNERSKITDQDANKIIELYIAALCMRFCSTISLDHPESSKGDNPDVIAEINGVNWGFACKTIHTTNTRTLYENLEKAIDQIEKSSSAVGLPVINLKNVISHDKIWPKDHTFPLIEIPFGILWSDMTAITDSLKSEIGLDSLKALFTGKKSFPGVLFIAQSASSVFRMESLSPTASRISVMNLYQIIPDEFSESDIRVIQNLNHYMQLAN